MSKSSRLSEKWFHRGLWLVSLIFASFLIGLGSAVVSDLPQLEKRLELDSFLANPAQTQALRAQLDSITASESKTREAREQAKLHLQSAANNTRSAEQSLRNWLAARSATQRDDQDPEVLKRTQALDGLRQAELAAKKTLEQHDQFLLDSRQSADRARKQLHEMERVAQDSLNKARQSQDLRVFLYRLALTLPLLVLAGWLFVKQRKSAWWPFVWGFTFFAVFAFFVELVPYLPSYGGYVRYAVGIAITVLVGRWAIVALQGYLERQQQAESLPVDERRTQMSYDAALAHLSKGVCPGCERPVDLKDGVTDFCPHCGIGLYERCCSCNVRRSAFTKFCFGCGSANQK